MKCRENAKNLTADEWNRFVNAVQGVKAQDSVLHPGAQSRYDDFVETHLLAMHDMTTPAVAGRESGHSLVICHRLAVSGQVLTKRDSCSNATS